MFVTCCAYPIQDTSGTGKRGSSVNIAKHIQPLLHLISAAKAPFYISCFSIISLHESNSIFTESVPAAVAMGHSPNTQHLIALQANGHRQATSPVSQRTQHHTKRVCSALFNTPWQFSSYWRLCYFFTSTRNTCLSEGH